MSSLPRLSSLFSSEKIDDIYSLYKYEDIKSEWIIYQGNLEYFYGESIFKSALFRKYNVVLTCFINDKKENIVILYLYLEKMKSPYKYFQLEKNDELKDRCRKLIEGKAGLFFLELIIHRTDRGEIFGAQSVPERKLWIEKFNEAISRLGSRAVHRSVSDVPSSRSKSSCEDRSFPDESARINYTSFKDKDRKSYPESNRSLPINLPISRSHFQSNNMEYIEPKISPLEEENDKQMYSWEKIFYSNTKNDFTTLLNNIARTGTFLIRPSLQKPSSNNQQYTLCVYDNSHIYKFSIQQLPNHRYQLINRENQSTFDQISKLCEYYTTHPLYITGKDGLDKHLYLTLPFNQENLYY